MTTDLHAYLPQVIRFHYYEYQKDLVHQCLSTIFGMNHRIFRGGVYLYHDLVKKEGTWESSDILYIGMTNNYADRFHTHNLCNAVDGNKREQIDKYFQETNSPLGLMLFAFKNPCGEFPEKLPDDYFLYSESEDQTEVLDNHHAEQTLEKFERYKTLFERTLASSYKGLKGDFPKWWDDSDKEGIGSDESNIQARRFIKYVIGSDDYESLDYTFLDGFKVAKAMQESSFGTYPSLLRGK